MKRALQWSIAVLLVAGIATAVYVLLLQPSWPEFPATEETKPQVQVSIERDYAYRIGDVISLEMVIRQQPGTRVQISTLTVGGDFELHEKPVLETRQLKDGAALYRLRFKLQSFEPKPRLSFTAAFTWDDLKKKEQNSFELPEKLIGTGMTWDGRQQMQEGTDHSSALGYWLRALVPLTCGSLLFFYFSIRALLHWWIERRKPTEAELLRDRFRALLTTVLDGTCSAEGYRELEAIVRRRWNVEAVPVEELQQQVQEREWKQAVTDFLALTALGIYPAGKPSVEELQKIAALGENLIPGLMASPAMQAPTATPVPQTPIATQPTTVDQSATEPDKSTTDPS